MEEEEMRLRYQLVVLAVMVVRCIGASPLLSVMGVNDGGFGLLTRQDSYGHWLGQAWTFDTTFTAVRVSAEVNLSSASGTALLTDAIGPEAAASNVIASAEFASPGSGVITFLDDLTVGPGTYYFLVTIDSGEGGWQIVYPERIFTAPGVLYHGFVYAYSPNAPLNFDFPPASQWLFGGANLAFEVAAVPESASAVLVAWALIALASAGWLRRVLHRREVK
jgi:hypothetical protein